jgi:hypothetical protein
LRHRRTTPELEYLLASWGSRMPYRRAAELLGELLPLQEGPVAQSSCRLHYLLAKHFTKVSLDSTRGLQCKLMK